MRSVLRHPTLDAAFKELVLTLPSETYIAEQLDVVDPQRIHAVREAMRMQLARRCSDDWQWAFEPTRTTAPTARPGVQRRRALAGLALAHLCLAPRTAATRCGPARPTSASRTPAT
jgi:aminopeptidase N